MAEYFVGDSGLCAREIAEELADRQERPIAGEKGGRGLTFDFRCKEDSLSLFPPLSSALYLVHARILAYTLSRSLFVFRFS